MFFMGVKSKDTFESVLKNSPESAIVLDTPGRKLFPIRSLLENVFNLIFEMIDIGCFRKVTWKTLNGY